MTTILEREKKIEEKIANNSIKDNPIQGGSQKAPLKESKRPEWYFRSPIRDVFFRYGEYFS